MNDRNAATTAVTVAIAGLTVTVECDEPHVVAGLRERYRPFLAEQIAPFKATVEVTDRTPAPARRDTNVLFHDDVLRFTTVGYDGDVDVDAQRAHLQLLSDRPVEDVDYFVRVIYALLAFRDGGMLFHAAGVVRDGRGYLFFGHSGSGKTTVARLSSDDVVLNDDLVLLLPEGDGWRVYATPFWNPTQVAPTRHDAPLAAMFRLVQDTRVFVEEMRYGQAVAEIVSNVPVIPDDPQRTAALLERSRRLLEVVPVYKLHFLPDDSFWHVVMQTR